MKRFYLLVAFLIISCEDNNTSTINQELTFISSEGNFGSSNASISVYKGEEEIQKIEDIGDVLQSILVHGNKLFAILNNSHLIKVYSISEEGLALPGIDIPTNTSSPREMVVVGNYLYFTNWNSQDVKYLNLTTYKIEGSIKVDGMPEGIISDQTNLFVAINMNSDYSSASTVVKINISSRQVTNEYKVGKGPHALALEGDNLWVTNRYYDDSYLTYIGTSKIDLTTGNVNIKENVVSDFYLTPDYFEIDLATLYGSGFSIQPKFSQSAYFRFHNQSEIYKNLYFVGAGTHPGAGMPGVLSSAKVLDKLF